MGLTAFDPDSSTKETPETGWGTPALQASDQGDMARAVADLLQSRVLTQTFGVQEEWEVRTTLVTDRRAWRYQSRVFVHGKEARKEFSPIDVDRTRQIRQAAAVTEEMVAAFAREAVEVHFARCASVAEYIAIASIFSQPLPRHHWTKKAALVLLSVAVLSTGYWFWKGSTIPGPSQLDLKALAPSVRWRPLEVSYRYPAGEPFVFPLPALERTPEGTTVEVTLEASGDEPSWLQLDRERLQMHGTAPRTAEEQTYRLIVRANAEEGNDSRLLVLLTITGQPERAGQPERSTPTPQLRGHWAW
jgi:hypothetical protein